eukprot:TRINITY_DN1762_c0_g2_i2.p1 TRINITY_DN1762_c0_g2~~TRINITY_DN1762_c0_g2_i2.p1  ORF type:complete len:316 (-),score=30.75 TRINITY_DN1762_c0_g2_i2:115-960(-)
MRTDHVAVAVVSSLITSMIFYFLVTDRSTDPSLLHAKLLQQQPAPPPPVYVPTGLYEVPQIERSWIVTLAKIEVPTLVRMERRALTLEIAYYLLRKNILGDFVETGVFTGGTAILLMKSLHRWDNVQTNKRQLWACDSFEGLPAPDQKNDIQKEGPVAQGSFSASLETFSDNMKKYDAYDETRLHILKGWFSDTLPTAPITKISFLRLDGDLYVSTRDPLLALYHKVSRGGIVYVDDYNSYEGCKRAVDEFRAQHNITSPLIPQRYPEPNDWYEAVYWYVE